MDNWEKLAADVIEIYRVLQKEGYNPTGQITGYLISGDLTYITSKAGARKKAQGMEQTEILELLLEHYFATGTCK